MNIKYEDGTVEVHICEPHAEESTIKDIREAYAASQEKIKGLIAEIESFGYVVTKKGEPAPTPTSQPAPQAQAQPTADDEALSKWAGKRADAQVAPQVHATDSEAAALADVQAPHELPQLKREVKREEGAGSVNIQDPTGTTNIKIVPGASNKQIEDRVKMHAADPATLLHKSNSDCVACGGAGIAFNGQTCPRCKGSGTIMR
jgi:hypothetical protein